MTARHDGGDELIRLASADNFRDVAGVDGYLTTDGVRLRRGVLFRSNELQLTDEDAGALAALGITCIYDLRSAREVEEHPDLPVPGATWRHVPVGGIPPGMSETLDRPEVAADLMHGIYRGFVTDPAARASFADLFRGLAESSGAQLFHCTAGKDRTGWAAAVILELAGVPRETVDADYLLTNQVASATRSRLLDLIAANLGEHMVEPFGKVMVADLSYLKAARQAVLDTYGDVHAYAVEGLGLSDQELSALRDRLR